MPPRLKVINIDCNFDYTYERQRLDALGLDLELRKAVTEDEIIAATQDADFILVEGAKTPMTARVISALPKCRLIAKYAVGVDNVDIPAATARGVVVANAADYCTEEVSDHAVALLLGGARRIVSMDRWVHAGQWSGYSKGRPLRRISQLTLGLVGLGRIARATARKMAGFQLRILATDPYLTAPVNEYGIQVVPMDQLLRESDLISVHVPLMAETRGLLNDASFQLTKPTAFLVNTSRGPVIDEPALIRALEQKRLGGAGLDVTTEEPLAASSPLRGFDQVILTPHSGADSSDSLAHARRTVIDTVEAVARGYWPPFPMNPKATPRQPLQPYAAMPRA